MIFGTFLNFNESYLPFYYQLWPKIAYGESYVHGLLQDRVKGGLDMYQIFMTIYFHLCKMCEKSDFPKYSHIYYQSTLCLIIIIWYKDS